MRKVIFAINMTLDGCCDHTKILSNEEMLEYFTQLLQDADLFVYGRKTYQLMVPYWPDVAKNHSGHSKAEVEFAQAFDSIKNIIVFSGSLEKAGGKNTRIVRSNPQEEILKLKQERGKNILTGGVSIPSQLIASGLVDEYYFVVHPIIAGAGSRLFDEMTLQEGLQLNLVESKIFKSGCVGLHYLKP